MKIVAMTVLCVDHFEQENRIYIGGNSLNFAAQCRRDRMADVSLIGAVGNDSAGEKILFYLDKNKIDRTHVHIREGKTASNRILINEQGDRYFPENAWDGGVYQDFTLSEADWDFALSHDLIAIPANNINFREAIKRKKDRHLLCVDFLDLRDTALMEETIPGLDLAFISGDDEIMAFAKHLSQNCPTIITITLGAEGSVSYQNGQETRIKAAPVREVKDTTGCGDVYQAAYATSFYQHRNIERALKAGSLAAAKNLEHIGAIDEAETFGRSS